MICSEQSKDPFSRLIFIYLSVIQKRKTCCYVDLDQMTGEDNVKQCAASLAWPGVASSIQPESNAHIKCIARESVTYEDEDTSPILHKDEVISSQTIGGRLCNNQFGINSAFCGNWMQATCRLVLHPLLLYVSFIYNSRCFHVCFMLKPIITVLVFILIRRYRSQVRRP